MYLTKEPTMAAPKTYITDPDKYGEGRTNSLYTGYKELSGEHWGLMRTAAKRRAIEFAITIEQAWDLLVAQDNLCALSGLPIRLYGRSKERRAKQTASLDRIDNEKGYTLDNVQWVHKHLNNMKLIHSQEYFIELCTAVAEHNKQPDVPDTLISKEIYE
jgi:hypothetical protein